MSAYAALMARSDPSAYEGVPTYAQVIRGDEEFAARVSREAADPEVVVRALTPERVARLAATALEVFVPSHKSSGWRVRAITGYVGRERGRIPLTRTASFFGRHGTTLVRDVRRLEEEMAQNAEIRELVDSVKAEISNAAIQR